MSPDEGRPRERHCPAVNVCNFYTHPLLTLTNNGSVLCQSSEMGIKQRLLIFIWKLETDTILTSIASHEDAAT